MKLMKQLSAALMSFLFQSIEPAWALESQSYNSRILQQSSSEEHCHRSEHRKALWVAMTTEYPVRWETPDIVRHPNVRVRIGDAAVHVEPLGVVNKTGPTSSDVGITDHKLERPSHFRLKGSDGNWIHIKNVAHGWIVYRRFHEYFVSYQHSESCITPIEVDDAVLALLKH